MTSVIDSPQRLYEKYVTLYDFIDVLEHDLPPPRINYSSNLYPTLPLFENNYNLINAYCHTIFKNIIYKKEEN
ncbi:hypothetical protein [Diatraea saccharalis granulovirus]|uniref:Uncharacterized protein n=1 Tax=Diatraea saccharalis granulovirus TaxID=1675862 RepID=A0A0R7EYZ3_9BBAC|nr:hypothetical protein [Diatraea saccharalis granulovirus]AKN80802.1 hypothetical protein [Diatraea saccharalis granulovirus]